MSLKAKAAALLIPLLLLSCQPAMAQVKLSAINNGGTINVATDQCVAVRGGTTDELVTIGSLPNSALANSSMTLAGHSVSLGGTQTFACGDLSNSGTACTAVAPANTTGTTHQFFNTYTAATGAFGKGQPACADISDAGTACTAVAPANTTATASNFFTAYTAATGAFTKAQPACGDLSNSSTGCTTTVGSLATLNTINNGNWSGTALAIGNGGTGQTTKAAAFDALQPMTTSGDVIYGGASGTGTRLGANSTGTNKYLQSVSSGIPAWAQVAFGDLSGNATNAQLATQSANTVLGALTATTPSGLSLPSCTDTSGNHLNYTSGTGFSCGTSDLHVGTVTSVATTSPITGGTITATGTIACATCATTTNGGALTATSPMAISAAGVISINAAIGGTYLGDAATGAQTIVLVQYAPYAFTINTLKNLGTVAGTVTGALQINGSNVTSCSALSLTSTPAASTSCTAANAVVAGDKVTFVTSSPSSLTGLLAFSMIATRS